MAAKEKKLSTAKHLKEGQGDKEKVDTPKTKRGRKSFMLLENKKNFEEKASKTISRKKRKKNEEGGQNNSLKKRPRRNEPEQEEWSSTQTISPLQGNNKLKKVPLEKELGDLLENATGRNTPLLPRGKKVCEKEEENSDLVDEKGMYFLSKTRKIDLDDDSTSVKSLTSTSKAKKVIEKEVDDDSFGLKNQNGKSKRCERKDEETVTIKNLIRPSSIAKTSKRKKSVLAAIVVKKKIFVSRKRQKKTKDVDPKDSHHESKVSRVKGVEKSKMESKQKRIIKKPLKFQNKLKDQSRMRPAMTVKNQKISRPKLKISDGNHGSRQLHNLESDISFESQTDQATKEKLKSDTQVTGKSEGSLEKGTVSDDTVKKTKSGRKKRKNVKKENIETEKSEKASDIYFFSEEEMADIQDLGVRKRQKIMKLRQSRAKILMKKNSEGRKQRRESGIHFETTRSPDDASVIIVQPRLGPKIKGSKRLKPILPKVKEENKRGKNLTKDLVPINALPSSLNNYNQINNSYFVQSIPNFNLFATKSAIISYSSHSGVNGSQVVNENRDFSVSPFGAKVSPNEIIVTPSGIVLSGSRLVSPGTHNSPTVCFNGSETLNEDFVYARDALENISASGLIYQSSTTVIRPRSCSNQNPQNFLKSPEIISTSLVSAATEAFGKQCPSTASDVKSSNETMKTISEKTSEKDSKMYETIFGIEPLKSVSEADLIPSVPVAKSVSDLIFLKKESQSQSNLERNTAETTSRNCLNTLLTKYNICDMKETLRFSHWGTSIDKFETFKKEKLLKNLIKNVRRMRDSSMELTFSEPETSCRENKEFDKLRKTISHEVLEDKSTFAASEELTGDRNSSTKFSVFCRRSSVPLFEKSERWSEMVLSKEENTKELSPKIKEAVEVCRFSKENEEALKEFGLDSDLDQTKSENDCESPSNKNTNSEEDVGTFSKTRIKEEVDNILKEMPLRKTTEHYKSPKALRVSCNKIEFKPHYMRKNNDFLSKSSLKPPTVIDKLLERNKSLKKAEEEGKFGSPSQGMPVNAVALNIEDVKHKKIHREGKSRKYSKGLDSKKVSHKKLVSKLYERRGSNPEIYSNHFVSIRNQGENENVPLRRMIDVQDLEFPKKSSVKYESVQKVYNRRCSLPIPSEDFVNAGLSRSMDDVNNVKSDKIKTIIVGSSKPLMSKNKGSEIQPRVINIVTSNCGHKKGKNLMEEVGLKMKPFDKPVINGGTNERRVSTDSSNSESEKLHSLMNGLTEGAREKLPLHSSYFEGKDRKLVDKMRDTLDKKTNEGKGNKNNVIEESPEDLITKETILSALGLQSLKAAQSAQKKKESQNQQSASQSDSGGYTGTLKAVIKIQRQEKKGSSKSPVKMVYKASSAAPSALIQHDEFTNLDEIEASSIEDADESILEENKNGSGKAKSLVIPEKASSFSIHPGRMCSDVCTYCFGKFGLLDTPCHIAQLKDVDKRRNILATEVHLTADSCLCDACFRHVDKKSNGPAFTDKKGDMKRRVVRKQFCLVQNCNSDSQHSIKRKLFLKLKKSIGRKLVLDAGKLEKLQPGQSLTFCNRHIYWIDYFMSCGICKKRLTSVNMYRVTSEVLDLNAALSSDEIPAILTENRFLCKICNCFASIRIKCKNPSEMSSGHRQFYETCRKRILKCHGMDVPDSEPEIEGKSGTADRKALRKAKRSSKPSATVTYENSKSDNDVEISMEETDKTNESEKELQEVSHLNIPPKTNGNLDFGGVSITPTTTEVNPTQIHVKLGNLNIGALGNLNIGQDVRHGTRSGDGPCFPTESELSLRAHFDLKPSAEDESAKTPRKGFEKCTTTIQFNSETKTLFYNLQMPYGNQSSFFRHLILLEKYFRNGDLVVSRSADPKAVSYISSVQNRIRSYEGVHCPSKKSQELSPSLSILPQPIKTESRHVQDVKPSAMPSRPFTLTPMPPTSSSAFQKNSPLSQIQATVQNIQPSTLNQNPGVMTSLLKSSIQPSKITIHPKPEVSITSVSSDSNPQLRVGKPSVLTKKIQENLRNLASKSQTKHPNQARAVILNRTVGGQKQSLVQVTTGGKTIHLTLSQFRRIQQMQMRKKQYLEHQAKMLKTKEDQSKIKGKSGDDGFSLKILSPELEIQEVKPATNDSEVFPLISEVRSLAGEEPGWDQSTDTDSIPKIPKTLSVSVTKIPFSNSPAKEQPVE